MRSVAWIGAALVIAAANAAAPPPSDTRVPEAMRTIPPAYPEAARGARLQGTVVVGAWVGKDGLVKKTHIVRSVPGLDEAAKRCVQQWTFLPARYKGKPIPAWITVPVAFTLH